MTDYDFNTLNDKEFEVLCCDLLSIEMGRRLERFKPGRDAGVDGRFFSSPGREVILQCKHWPASPIEKLIAHLGKNEAPKVMRLKPDRYLLALSHPLSRRDKNEIANLFSGYLKSDADIFGREDLNDLLSRNREAEQRHYKLWIRSSGVLNYQLNKGTYDRSEFALEEIMEASKRYVRTANHTSALKIADSRGVVIIAGEPGIGKTSLAEQLCLDYVANGFTLVKVGTSIAELEAVFERDKKQVFYFDDFLGRNYLEALHGHEGSQIVHFIRRVTKDASKRFILTSRSTILNRGRLLIDSFQHQKLENNELLLTIKNLSDLDKAMILYNHIWFSGLPEEFKEQIYVGKRYRQIIAHRNYNPRLISFITDRERLAGCAPEKYWNHIERSLQNPADVWENPFVAQQDDFGRAIVLLVTVEARRISESSLSVAFSRFISSAPNLRGSHDFLGTMKQLTGSLISRHLDRDFSASIDLFNPSLADYVLRRYSADISSLELAISSLRSIQALRTLASLLSAGIISPDISRAIIEKAFARAHADSFIGFGQDYVAKLAWEYAQSIEEGQKTPDSAIDALEMLLEGSIPADCCAIAGFYCWCLVRGELSVTRVVSFVRDALGSPGTRDDSELQALSALLLRVPSETPNWQEALDRLKEEILFWVSEQLEESVSESDAFSGVDYGDYSDARRKVADHVSDLLTEFGPFEFDTTDIRNVVDGFGVRSKLDKYFEGDSGYEREHVGSHNRTTWAPPNDPIDDLFDRS